MTFIAFPPDHRSHRVTVAIRKRSYGTSEAFTMSIGIADTIANLARIELGERFKVLFGSDDDFGRVALARGGHVKARREGRQSASIYVKTRCAPWSGGIRDAEGKAMRLLPTARLATEVRWDTDHHAYPLVLYLPQDWFGPVESAAVFRASVWQRRKKA